MLALGAGESLLLVLLLLLYAGFEGLGIGLLLPVLQYLEAGSSAIPTGGVWGYLVRVAAAIHVPLNLGTLLGFALLPILARQGVYYLNVWYSARIQNRAVEQLSVRVFGALVRADLGFVESEDQGRLISVVAGYIAQCGQAATTYLRLVGSLLIILVYVLLLSFLSWPLALLAAVSMALVSAGVRKIMVATRAYGRAASQATVALTSAVRERIAAIRLLKMRAREEAEIQRVSTLAARVRFANTKIMVSSAQVEVLVDPALMLAVFVIIFVGVEYLGMNLASLGLFMFILLRLNAKAKEVNLGRQSLAAVMPGFDLVETTLVASESARAPQGGTREFLGLRESIEFDAVWFRYEPDSRDVLSGISMSVPRGSMTALVGRSGAGKSTLVDMVPLLRQPTAGRILFDGQPADSFELGSLRRRIGFLGQEPILFDDTIRSNLIYGFEGHCDDARINRALEDSYCAEFIADLPQGLETRLGDRGVRFSGGQRQRLALARVLLEDPDILILDEPTSALDSESERYIQAAFERISQNRTVVVIAHRLSTVERASQIVVLEHGVIVESGTHVELLAANGSYRRLFDMQIHA